MAVAEAAEAAGGGGGGGDSLSSLGEEAFESSGGRGGEGGIDFRGLKEERDRREGGGHALGGLGGGRSGSGIDWKESYRLLSEMEAGCVVAVAKAGGAAPGSGAGRSVRLRILVAYGGVFCCGCG